VNSDRAEEIEEKIAQLKRRWPAHSTPPGLWQELEELEGELQRAVEEGTEDTDGREAGAGRLQ
jgi:hypothetical protein